MPGWLLRAAWIWLGLGWLALACAQTPGIREIDSATLVGPGGSRTVALPHVLQAGDFAPRGSRVRYQLVVDVGAVPDPTLAVYVPKLSLSGALWLNGRFVRGCEPLPLERSRCLHRPYFFDVPASLWQPGHNVLEFEVYASDQQMNGLSRVYVGPATETYVPYLQQFFARVGVMRALTWTAGFIGLLALAMSPFTANRRVYVWFGIACLANAFANGSYLAPVAVRHPEVFSTYAFASRLVAVALLEIALLAVYDLLSRRLGALLLGYAAAMPLVVALSGNDRDVVSLLYGPLAALGIWLLVQALRVTRRTRDPLHVWVCIACALLLISGIIDFARLRGATAFEGVYLLSYGSTGLMVIFGFHLVTLMGQALKQSRSANRLLEEEVQRRTAQLRAANDQLEQRVAARTKELRLALADAKQGALVKSRFLATMSHEIRTPLTGLIGTLQLAREEPDRAEHGELMDMAHSSATQLRALLDDVLDVSRLEAGGARLAAEPVDLARTCAGAVDGFASAFATKGLELRLQLPARPVEVITDAVKVRQILDNLLSNALKFTATGSVTVCLQARASAAAEGLLAVELSVADTGCGVPADKRQRIFEMFEQGDGDRIESRTAVGTGLGLTLCRLLARLLGGDIAHADRAGGGSIFRFRFEARRPGSGVIGSAMPARHAAPSPVDLAQLAGSRILVVDDNRLIQTVVSRTLARRGLVPTVAGDAEQALRAARQRRFDAILMDISMPGTSGLECTRLIRRMLGPESATDGATVPIIGISAHTLAGDAEACLAAGMTAYVPKPIDWNRLFKVLLGSCGRPVDGPSRVAPGAGGPGMAGPAATAPAGVS